MSEDIIRDQIDYYRARAGEYDEWFLRRGRFDHGPELNERWFAEADQVRAALDEFAPRGEVLELACGTGLWSQHLAQHADALLAVDASAEVIELNRQRLDAAAHVAYHQSDIFSWQPDRQYDVVFFSFWLSHVPPDRFDAFWRTVRSALKSEGRFFLIDSLYNPTTTAHNHVLLGREATVQDRKLNDGRTYRIVKIYYEPEALSTRLQSLGFACDLHRSSDYFLYGSGTLI